eukprot:SAG31_NODE_3680_length_3993_cov_1.941463_3_plen_410_part_00
MAGHDLAWGAVSLWGGVDQLRTWCDHNATCIGYAVDTSLAQPQVWFKAAAALDYHGMAVSTCPSSKDCTSHPCPSDKWVPQWGSCPYGGHTGSVWTAGGLYIKCANKTKSFVCTGKAGLYQCVPGNSSNPTPTNGTSYPKEQQCLEACKAPPPPPPAPGPPPPAPHYDKPYLRFAMVIPMPQMVDCTITQGSVSHTWSQYGFGQFSDWISTFKAASASLTIATGGTTLLTQQVTLTPGPLVVALRPDNNPPGHYWPPTKTSIELIAASYSPTPTGTSGARLMNLSPDTDVAGEHLPVFCICSQTIYSLCRCLKHPHTVGITRGWHRSVWLAKFRSGALRFYCQRQTRGVRGKVWPWFRLGSCSKRARYIQCDRRCQDSNSHWHAPPQPSSRNHIFLRNFAVRFAGQAAQ